MIETHETHPCTMLRILYLRTVNDIPRIADHELVPFAQFLEVRRLNPALGEHWSQRCDEVRHFTNTSF